MRRKLWIFLMVFSLFGAATALAAGADGLFKGHEIVSLAINGKPLQSETPAINFEGTTMVPLRDVTKALGAGLVIDSNTSTMNIVKPNVHILVTTNDIPKTPVIKAPFGSIPKGSKESFNVYAAVDEAPIGHLYFRIDIVDPDGNRVFKGDTDGTVFDYKASSGHQQFYLIQPISKMDFAEKGKYHVRFLMKLPDQDSYQVFGEKVIEVN